jgi:hypothetical protein
LGKDVIFSLPAYPLNITALFSHNNFAPYFYGITGLLVLEKIQAYSPSQNKINEPLFYQTLYFYVELLLANRR